MRRLVVALIVVALSFSLAGCGGGGEEAAEPAAQTPAASTPAAVAAPAVVDESPDTLSPLEDQEYVLFPNDPAITPPSIASRLVAGQAMVVFLNDGTESVTFDQLDIIEEVLDDYTGLVDLVGFDIGKYVTTETSGTITITDGFEDDAIAKQAIGLVKALDVGFTPYIVIVDEYGYITWRVRGYVDAATLGAQIQRATGAH